MSKIIYLSESYPKVGHGVDLHREVNHVVGALEELLARHDARVVHQDVHLAHLFFHLQHHHMIEFHKFVHNFL